MIPIGFLTKGITMGSKVLGQWNGAYAEEDGTISYGYQVEQIVCKGIFKIFDIPDEPGITLYEPTVSKIYRKYGWYWCVYYNLAFRNVGHGWFYLFKQDLGTIKPTPESLLKTFCGISYGLKPYEDWRSYTINDLEDGILRFYGIPALGKS